MDQDLLHAFVTIADASFTAFRIATHVPELFAVLRQQLGARVGSIGSWVVCAAACVRKPICAPVIADDWLACGIDLPGAGACAAIANVAAVRQRRVGTGMPLEV